MPRPSPESRARRRPAIVAALALAAIFASPACRPGERPTDGLPADLERTVRELYERAREAGEEVPPEAFEWARRDIERIGDWEYHVERIAAADDAALAKRLGELGEARWEAFWIEREDGALRVLFKRPARSVLRVLPVDDLGRLLSE